MNRKLFRHMPSFPRTPHVPYKPNVELAVPGTAADVVATHAEVAALFLAEDVFVTEKVDGTNVGLCLWDEHPAIRTKQHFLNKGFLGRTSAKNQYRPLWNWFHDHLDAFHFLEKSGEFRGPPVVYGEWMNMAHGVLYTNLPDLMVGLECYDGAIGDFLPPDVSRDLLVDAGFVVPPLLYRGRIEGYAQLEEFCQSDSEWVQEGDRRREGVYLRWGDSRYKMVREDFVRGVHFGDCILKNRVRS